MSGGVHALRGFAYQATVTLDLLLGDAFIASSERVEARPEGDDDLVLRRQVSDRVHEHYVQVKKPREDSDAERTERAWTLAEVVAELLEPTIARLRGNDYTQTWILGDDVDARANALVTAGEDAPDVAREAYLTVLHHLARRACAITSDGVLLAGPRRRLERWNPDAYADESFATAMSSMSAEFVALVRGEGGSADRCAEYETAVLRLHEALPTVLARTRVESTYGSEGAIRERVEKALMERYGLPLAVVRGTLVQNLRGFVQDISSQPGRWFDREELELELRRVWPRMNLVGEPPQIEPKDIRRRGLVARVLEAAAIGPVEVIGGSGAGKTKLASAIVEELNGGERGMHAFYTEVRPHNDLRDVLAGVAFRLRRLGIREPFAAAIDLNASDERALLECASVLGRAAASVVLILDLVDGNCSERFARELAIVIRRLRPSFRLICLGQHHALRALPPLERHALAVPDAIDPSFDFDELYELVKSLHRDAVDRATLSSIFEAFTAARSSVLPARVAHVIAQEPSLESMQALAELPLDKALAEADRSRYAELPGDVRAAADHLVCFLLPFSIDEAARVFPSERAADAARALLQRGLLRVHSGDLLEMHETVRAGLEGLLPRNTRIAAHAALARHYVEIENVSAGIRHFEFADRENEAHRTAREMFLAGRHRSTLASYVAQRGLVTADEVATWLQADPAPKDAYVLPAVLRQVGDDRTAQSLLEGIDQQVVRFDSDGNWAWRMTEAVLSCDPTRLYDLAKRALAADDRHRLDSIAHAARRCEPVVDARLLSLFGKATEADKARLARLLLLDARRAVLAPVLAFLAEYDGDDVQQLRADASFRLRTNDEVTELVAAIPRPEVSDMLLRKSPLFGRLDRWLWAVRDTLEPFAVEALAGTCSDEAVVENAIRLLLFFGNTSVISEAERRATLSGRLGALCTFVPALAPQWADAENVRRVLVDGNVDVETRTVAFSVLVEMGVDAGDLFDEAMQVDPERAELWKFMFVTKVASRPHARAVPVLEALISDATDERTISIFAPIVHRLGELDDADAGRFVERCLESSWPKVRLFACTSLQQRRTPSACARLIAMAHSEEHPVLAQTALVAAVATGAAGADLRVAVTDANARAWRATAVGRRRESGEAASLIETATQPDLHWQARRAAILAATRLEDPDTLGRIGASVLCERSPYTLDESFTLVGHATLTWFLREVGAGKSLSEKGQFVAALAPLFERVTESLTMFPEGAPSGEEAAAWLFERLSMHGWPSKREAANVVLDELHVPILHAAVLRGYRRLGRVSDLEYVLTQADSLWLFLRAFSEVRRVRGISTDDRKRIMERVEKSTFHDSPFVRNMMRRFNESSEKGPIAPPKPAIAPPAEANAPLGYDDVIRALDEGALPRDGAAPVVLGELSVEELTTLARELDPQNDATVQWVTRPPYVALDRARLSVRTVTTETRARNPELRKMLRPALAAANTSRIAIPWHSKLLATAAPAYAEAFLVSVAARRDAARLYAALDDDGPALFRHFDDAQRIRCIGPLLDVRIVPVLRTFARVGTDALLHSMCWMATFVDDEAVDEVLALLFARWLGRFHLTDRRPQHVKRRSLWRAFAELRRHPRFHRIPGYDLRLMELSRVNLAPYHLRDIVDAIATSPRAYTQFEMLLLNAAPFDHDFDEVDRLDERADALYR